MRGISFSKVYPRGSRFGFLRRGHAEDPASGTWILYETKEAAERDRRGCLAERTRAQSGPTIAEAVKLYLAHLKRQDRTPQTLRTTADLIKGFWPDQAAPLASVSESDYEAMIAKPHPTKERPYYSAAFHHQALIRAKAVCNFAVRKGLLKSSPLAEVEPQGRARKGKLHLTLDEVALWTAEALRRARSGDETALACLLCWLLGFRAGEACAPSVRDLDAGGTILWTTGKTGRRKVLLTSAKPEAQALLTELRALLGEAAARARGEGRIAPLLQTNRLKVWRGVKAICRAAGVPEVCPHSFRGLHAAIRVQSGEDVGSVAASVGNSARVLGDHYLKPGDAAQGHLAQVLPLIGRRP